MSSRSSDMAGQRFATKVQVVPTRWASQAVLPTCQVPSNLSTKHTKHTKHSEALTLSGDRPRRLRELWVFSHEEFHLNCLPDFTYFIYFTYFTCFTSHKTKNSVASNPIPVVQMRPVSGALSDIWTSGFLGWVRALESHGGKYSEN